MPHKPTTSKRNRVTRQARKAPFRRRIGTRTISVQHLSQAPYVAAVVQHGPDGRERLRKCRTMSEAKTMAKTWCADAERHGLDVSQSLTPAELAAVAELKRDILAAGLSVADMIANAREWLGRSHRRLSVATAADACLERKEAQGLSRRHAGNCRFHFRQIVAAFGDRDVADVTPDELRRWIDTLAVSNASKNAMRRHASLIWSHAETMGAGCPNPAKALPQWKATPGETAIFTPAEARTLMSAADPKILPALAIGLFAGLRRSELIGLDWRHVHASEIEVTAMNAKSSRRRFVPIHDNLAEWLAPYRKQSGKVVSSESTWKRWFERAKAEAGITDPSKNDVRHSFGSYFYALTDDAGKVAAALGHTDSRTVFNHYRALARKTEAEAYFNLQPPTAAGNVVRFAATTA